jgi:hypothetical protein
MLRLVLGVLGVHARLCNVDGMLSLQWMCRHVCAPVDGMLSWQWVCMHAYVILMAC